MAKAITLYTQINQYSAELFVNKLQEIESGEDLDILMNCPGGGVFAGWSIIGPLAERKGKNNAKVYGDASSMALYSLLFMDNVECLDVTHFVLHRADGYIENEEDRLFLLDVNKQLRAKLEAKIDKDVFKTITGKSIADVFNPDQRINVRLNARQAKAIKLVDKINRLDPKQIKAINEKFIDFIDFEEIESRGSDLNIESRGSDQEKDLIEKQKTIKKMTKEEFRAQNPEAYQSIYAEGKEAGITIGKNGEKDRIGAFLKFVDIDMKAVKDGIEKGENPSMTFMAEMAIKANSPEVLAKLKAEAVEPQVLDTKEPKGEKGKTEVEKEVEAFEKDLDVDLNLNQEVK